jgi:hypothetical protein
MLNDEMRGDEGRHNILYQGHKLDITGSIDH